MWHSNYTWVGMKNIGVAKQMAFMLTFIAIHSQRENFHNGA